MAARAPKRRAVRWETVRGPKAFAALLIGTALGAGLSPFAPGTMGSLVALPVAYGLGEAAVWLKLAVWIGLFIAGVWAAMVFDQSMGSKDNPSIVIDEVVGLGITSWTAGHHMETLVAAFILFRVFDILKPPPVRQMDRWSKVKASGSTRLSAFWGGFGVMADDVLAGVQGLIAILLLQYWGILP